MDTDTAAIKTLARQNFLREYRRNYHKNLTPQQREAKRRYAELAYRRSTPAQVQVRQAYGREKMRERRKDPGYALQFARYHRAHRESAKEGCMNMYSNGDACCAICRIADMDVLTLDHLANDGRTHRTAITGKENGTSFYMRLRTLGYPPGLQVLCFNCNSKKELLRKRSIRKVLH